VLNGDALVSFKILERSGLAIHSWDGSNASAAVSDLLRQADWLVDCLLGTGMTGVVREPMVTAIQQINSAPAKRLAIDIPSGLDCDTGQPCPEAVRADFTATFVATKLGFDQPLARQHTGMVQVFSIGICRQLLAQYART
jgi:NAD(P)H-hydrate epimerase